jgi:hypothetical protein
MSSVLGFLQAAVAPVAGLIDDLHTSKEEKESLRLEFYKLQFGIFERTMQYETQLLEAQSNIVVAEAQGQSWLQRSWRPITMLVFLGLVMLDSFGMLANPLAPEAWTLLQIGLGGYVVGRSVEKITPRISDAIGGAKG